MALTLEAVTEKMLNGDTPIAELPEFEGVDLTVHGGKVLSKQEIADYGGLGDVTGVILDA